MNSPAPRRLAGVTAAVLAGGLGTRLRPAVDDRPKVLAPVAGRPFVAYLLDALDAVGVRRIVLLTGYRGEQVREVLGERDGGAELIYSEERSPLGTGGALRAALPLLDSKTILLLNGDSYFGVDFAALMDFHQRRRAVLSLSLAWVDDVSRFGRVETNPDGRIAAFVEKNSAVCPGWINAGVYLLQRTLVEEITEERPISLERELLPKWMMSKAVFGRRQPGPFLDIGTPPSYASAEMFLGEISAAPRSPRELAEASVEP
jgi:NDP-sugar pyrophosphorylase family protein